MKAAEWIDRLKAARGWESDYRAAKELGVGRATVSKYRSNPDSTMDDDTAVKVADALQVEPEIVVLDQVTERTRSAPARLALAGVLERIGGKVLGGGGGGGKVRVDITSVAAAVAISAAALFGSPPAEAHQVLESAPNTHRVNRRKRRKSGLSPLQLLARALFPAPATSFA